MRIQIVWMTNSNLLFLQFAQVNDLHSLHTIFDILYVISMYYVRARKKTFLQDYILLLLPINGPLSND